MTLNKVCDIRSSNASKWANTLWSERMELSLAEVELLENEGHYSLNEKYNLRLPDNSGCKMSNLNAGELEFDIFAIFKAFCNS